MLLVGSYLKMGLSLEQASREAMTDLRRLTVPFPPRMNLVAVDARGRHTAMTTEATREVRYVLPDGADGGARHAPARRWCRSSRTAGGGADRTAQQL